MAMFHTKRLPKVPECEECGGLDEIHALDCSTLQEKPGGIRYMEGVPTPWPRPQDADDSPLKRQVGGDHYKKLAIQPAQYVHENGIPYLEGSVIYYVTRWRDKNGLADIRKAIHTLELLIELEEKNHEPK